jgi:hypothetical protein
MTEMAARSWEVLVREGRKTLAAESNAQWRLGGLALEVYPVGKQGVNSGVSPQLVKYAKEIGVAYGTLRRYRHVAAAWPEASRLPSAMASFGAHMALQAPEDQAMLHELAAEGPVTVAAARAAATRKPRRKDTEWTDHRIAARIVNDQVAALLRMAEAGSVAPRTLRGFAAGLRKAAGLLEAAAAEEQKPAA